MSAKRPLGYSYDHQLDEYLAQLQSELTRKQDLVGSLVRSLLSRAASALRRQRSR
jgi:hypothetical protein